MNLAPLRRIRLALLLLGAAACQQAPSTGAQVVKLNPLSVRAEPATDVAALLDRDTTTGLELTRPLALTLRFDHEVELRRLKVFTPEGVLAELGGLPALDASGGERWASEEGSARGREFTLKLRPRRDGARVHVQELELWGVGVTPAPRDAQALAEATVLDAPLENVRVLATEPRSATLVPRGLEAGKACAELRVAVEAPLGAVRRAFLAYEAVGLPRPVVLARSLNGRPAQGGFWLGAGAPRRTVADELDPAALARDNRLTVCLPDEATDRIPLEGLRLVLELDDGTQPFEREALVRLGAAADGDARTSAPLSAQTLELPFTRALEVDTARVELDQPVRQASPQAFDGAAWAELGPVDLEKGVNALALEGQVVRALRLGFAGARRADVPAASVAELSVSGSAVGPRLAAPRLVITYPALRARPDGFSAEHFAGRAFVTGWAESPAGRGVVELEGVAIDDGAGGFQTPLERPAGDAPWSVTLRARFPDGTELTRVLHFDRDAAGELAAASAGPETSAGGDDVRFGREEQTSWGRVSKGKGGQVKLGNDVLFDAPADAVDGELDVGITRKVPEAVPPLDPGMINVTAPVNAGYRFSPPGTKFKKAVAVTLPYDPALLPEGTPPESIQTFYYDRGAGQWKPLARKQVVRATQQVVSETDHFTFMINAVLALPDHPGPTSFDPTSIKDLKAADPSANIDLIEPPEGNNLGTARVGFPLRLPAARGTFAPTLQLAYDSGGGNGWLGVGWDIGLSSVAVDTRFGAPFFDGSERFALDGEQLVPVGPGPCADGSSGARYAARVERSFRRVVHCGVGTDADRFEVSQKDGTLAVYGATEGARVASPADARRIGQWMLERVVDANDNLTLYRYAEDRRRTPGTAFDARNGEDFRQLYPRQILYSGKVARRDAGRGADSFAPSEFGPYLVEFEQERTGDADRERPDVITQGKLGFKVVTRYRLGAVRVRLNTAQEDTVIREYRLAYERGDFGKSRLKRVELYGLGGLAGGKRFYGHDFEYTSVDEGGLNAFPRAVAWQLDGGDKDAMTASSEWSLGAHAYAGIGFTWDKQQGSVGVRVGFNHREGSTHATMVDLNGDGLPDRVSRSGSTLKVLLNDVYGQRLSATAPVGDPARDQRIQPFASGINLGEESGDSINAALQATFSAFSANVGVTRSFSTSTDFLADADGDGLVDYVGPGGVLFNQARGTDACAAGTFCFEASKPVASQLSFANLADAQGATANDPALQDALQTVEEDFHPTDAMLEWTAPYEGTVDVLGALEWLRQQTPPDPARDGVRLRVYREGTLLAEYRKAASDTGATAVSAPSVRVEPRTRLYFVLSTLRHFPVDTSASPPVALEEVRFSPRIQYATCTGTCGGLRDGDLTLVDPTGASVFTFDAEQDFKLAGEYMLAAQAAQAGVVRLSGTFASAGTADDVRVCVQRFPAGQAKARPCDATDRLRRTYASTGATEALSDELRVSAGDSLVFRVETDLPIDPDTVSWTMRGEMTEVCDDTTCRAPDAEEAERLRFDADPYFPLHQTVTVRPPRPLVVPADGTLHVTSSGTGADTVFFSGRKPGALLFKHRSGEQRTVAVPVRAGEQVLFEAHAEALLEDPAWSLDVALETRDGNGNPTFQPLHVQPQVTFDSHPLVKVPRSPFGGGFHGWRYGVWGGKPALGDRPEEPFDPSLFTAESGATWQGSTDRERFRDAKGKLRDEESEESRRSRLYQPLVPRRTGTQTLPSIKGLKPSRAFVNQDGTAFIGPGTMHGGRKGAVAAGPGQTRTVDGSLKIGPTSRASRSTMVSAGLGASVGPASLSFNVSHGSTSQRMDVRDMNGDGIIDVIVADDVRLTHLKRRTLRSEVHTPGSVLSESSDVTATAGMGLSSPVPQISAGGRIKGMEGMFPSGFSVGAGISATLSATDVDLVDVNGDGLSDQVRRDGDAFLVRLNYGSSFATHEDRLPVGGWANASGFDPFARQLSVDQYEDEDDEEAEARGGAMGVLEKVGSPDVVRRASAITLEGNIGFTWKEDYGVTANWSSSLNGTQVVLMDVTGDGLPDYVRKSTSENAFRVKVNRGWSFGDEEVWPLPDWPTGVTRPRFKVNPLLQDSAVRLLGLQNGIDTVEASGSHSRYPSVGFVVTVPIPLSPFGTPWLHLSGGADYTPERITGFELGLQDINGDGLADHVLKTEEQIARRGANDDRAANQNAVYARLNALSGGNLLKRVTRPLGGTFELAYARTGNTVDMPDSRFVLTEVKVDDGSGASGPGHRLVTGFAYTGGRHDRAERDFLGFATVTRTNPDGGRVVQRFANDGYLRKGLLLSEETRDAADHLFLAKVNTYGEPEALSAPRAECTDYTPFFLSPVDYCTPTFVPHVRSENRLYEGQTTDVEAPGMASAEVMHYESATGRITLFEDLGDLADPADDLHARVTYADSAELRALHHLELESELVVRAGPAGSPGALLRRRDGEYDAHGNLVRQRAYVDGTRAAETLLTWTADGMLETVTAPPNQAGQRYQVRYAYEPVTRALVRETSDSFGYTSLATYDLRFHEVASVTDVAGNVTRREYDPFGRLSGLWGPYDQGSSATVSVSYDHEVRPALALTRNKLPSDNGDDTLDTLVFVDGLARVIQTQKDSEINGHLVGRSVTGHLGFDVMGRTAVRGQTFFVPGGGREYAAGVPLRPETDEHDVLGRVVRSVGADGSVTTTEYGFGTPAGTGVTQLRAAVTDPLGNVRVAYRDVSDKISAVEEHLEGRVLTTRYETDPLGQLVRVVDTAGNASTNAYDLLGRRTALSTPDTGLTELRYDLASNVVERVDPNLRAAGLSIRYQHDYHHLVKVDRPLSEDVTFEYGAPGAPDNGAGRVVRILDEVGWETRGYGKLGEITRSTRQVRPLKPGDRPRTFTTGFEFDSFGRMLRVAYPDGEEVRYGYDAGGLVRTAVGFRPGSRHAPAEEQVYLRSMAYDEFGQRVGMELGNGVRSTYTYEPATRRLSTLTTRTPRGRTLQALTYEYDAVGNILGMTNALGQPVGRRSGAVTYTFSYDQLYRMTSAKGTALARPGLTDRFSSTFAYDDLHNMRRNAQVHELLSARSGQQHAARPDHSNHDDAYVYAGAGPHQATRIGDVLLTYDLNGNTLVECRTVNGTGCDETGGATPDPQTHDHWRRFTWTEDNALRAVTDGGGNNTTRFLYDAEGERVAKLGRGGVSLSIGQFFSVKGKRHGTKHVFAGPTRVASKLLPIPDGDVGYDTPVAGTTLTSGTGVQTANGPDNANGCVPSEGQPHKCDVVVIPPGGGGPEPLVKPATYYYHPDHIGSTSWVTDQKGLVHEHVEYFPFGEVWRDQRNDDDGAPVKAPNYLFSAKEFDEETGLGYFGARYYDPRKARWVNADPFREEWGESPSPAMLSLYAYANQSPLVWRDPTGKVPEWLHAALDVAGMVPVIGEVADGANALIYLSEGRYGEAAISAVGMIPVLGEAGKAGKWVAKGVKAGAVEAAQRYVKKEVKQELVQQAEKRAVKQGAEAGEGFVAREVKECAGSGCGVPGKQCFVAGTLVLTRDGLVPIEDVTPGTEVLSEDQATGAQAWRPVTRTFVTPDAALVDVELVDGAGGAETLGVTPEHPFWVRGAGWVPAGELRPGQDVLSATGGSLTVAAVRARDDRQTVFNFEVSDFHTYFVGVHGAWVHNNCTHGHHSDPKFAGGDPKQKLTKVQDKVHQDLHNDLNKHLEKYKNATGSSMRPKAGNSGAVIRSNFTRKELLQALADFYKGPGKKYADAARDFFAQHPHLK